MQFNTHNLWLGNSISDLRFWIASVALIALLIGSPGCASNKLGSGLSSQTVRAPLAGEIPTPVQLKTQSRAGSSTTSRSTVPANQTAISDTVAVAYRPQQVQQPQPQSQPQVNSTVRGQSPDNTFWYGGANNATANQPAPQRAQVGNAIFNQPAVPASNGSQTRASAIATTPGNTGNTIQQSAYQYPELATPGRNFIPGNGLPSPNIGAPNTPNPLVQPFDVGGNAPIPYYPAANFADLDVTIAQTNTGRVNIGGAFNSDNGIVGQFTIDEKDFDITRVPRNFGDILDGTAFRGAGQQFRLELVPGNDIQRYLVSFTEPFFLNTEFSFSASAYFFDRQFFDYDENRRGGRFNFGRRLTPDLSISAGLRLERVEIDDPRVNTSQELNDNIGSSNLYIGNVGLIRDTRDHPFLPTEGSYLSATYSQAFGDFDYSRGDVEYRRYRLLYQRPDRSGRHTLSYGTKLGISGDSTPIFENYFAGGFSTIRGFDFRGASPSEGDVRVGGQFQWLNTVEYQFPLTADDMIKGVLFCDFGTIERDVEIQSDNFRVAPGFGFRVHMPAAGIGAPLAFDFAFPVATADNDEERVFSFYLGVLR